MGDIRRWRRAIMALSAGLALGLATAPSVAADGLAVDDVYGTGEDPAGGLVIDDNLLGVLKNDVGEDVVLCVSSFDTTGLIGTLKEPGLTPRGFFTYLPPLNWSGTTSFTYQVATKVADVCPAPPANEGTATVTINIDPVNDAPTAVADSFSALKDRTLNVAAPGVLGNDSDVEGDSLTAIEFSSPAHGTLALAADGGFGYTPDAGYVGSDRFSYQASDGTDQSLQRIVTINVVGVPPTASPTPSPTPTPVPPTAVPEPSPSESPEPSDSGLETELPIDTFVAPSPSASPGPVSGPVSSEGGPPILAIGALVLLLGLLAVAAVYFVRSQSSGGEGAFETAGLGSDDDIEDDDEEFDDEFDDEDAPRA